jgi:hypothetical protein
MVPFWGGNQLVWTQKKSSKESSWFEDLRSKVGFNSRIQYASNESKLPPKNLDTSSKVGFNYKLATWNYERKNELKSSFKIC